MLAHYYFQSKPATKWNEDERNAVENYERRVANLCSERESYRSQLVQERAQLRAALKVLTYHHKTLDYESNLYNKFN